MLHILYVMSRPLEINTSASIRNKATIQGLLLNGYDVHVVTTEPDCNHSAYDCSNSIPEIKESTTFVRLNGKQSLIRFSRKLPFFNFMKKHFARFLLKQNSLYDSFESFCNHTDVVNLKKDKYDFIISSSDPKSSHLFVDKLLGFQREHFNGKWIQIWGDPFFHDMTRRNHNHDNLIIEEERRLLLRADKIVYVSPLTIEEQKQTYPEAASKMFYSPIPYVRKRIYPLKALNTLNAVEILYCGDYDSRIRNIKELIDAVSELNCFYLEIYGGSDKNYSSFGNITVNGRVPYDLITQKEQEADILVLLCNLSGGQIPGKLYQYSGTNKPILFILDGNTEVIKNCFKKYNRFYFCENNKEAIKESLCCIRDGVSSVKNVPIKEFDPSNVSKQIIN